MLSIYEAVLAVTAFWLAWEYCRAESVIWPDELAAPVTLEEQRAAEWLTALRPAVLAPHTGTRVRTSGYFARRRASSEYPSDHYTRG
jgi:hypothetical protein